MIAPFGILVSFISSLFVLRVKKLRLSDTYAKATLIIGKLCINQVSVQALYICPEYGDWYFIKYKFVRVNESVDWG